MLYLQDELRVEDVFKLSPVSAPKFAFDDISDTEDEARIGRGNVHMV
jgi:hypothetical protein